MTDGRFLWLEGRVVDGVFRNWARNFRYKPQQFLQPTSEEEIVEIVKSSKKVRAFGSAHSFNSGVVSDEVLISLDKFSGVIDRNLPANQMAFKGGTRIRDAVDILLKKDLAFKALPSHDAQSIAGIISTDVHGTGNDWGFVSELVKSIRLIDGKGDVHHLTPNDPLFKAAIGGIGTVGIISEVVVEAVEKFNVEQKFEISDMATVEKDFKKLFDENDHLSFYFFPFTDVCQISKWNRTDKSKSFLNELREFLAISVDALLAAWAGNFMAYTGLLPKLSSLSHQLKRGTDLIMESNAAYNRTIYHLHQELEFTVPFDETFSMVKKFIKLYEDLYAKQKLPYTLFEVRFTPNKSPSLIGAGHDRQCCWIDLVINDSEGFEIFYDAAEELMRQIGARPHLGKWCKSFTKSDLQNVHGNNLDAFLNLVSQHDPDEKFVNGFTQRLFK
jgi:FAD/FMN-containing dehydrogenase